MNTIKHIVCDGFQLNINIKGSGSPILVVGSSVYYPRLFSETLYKKYQFIFMDHRGFVKPPRTLKPEDYTLDKIVSDIEAVRQALQLSNVVILGHSGHAFMALEYAKQYSEHVDKVILLNAAPSNSRERQEGSQLFFQRHASKEREAVLQRDMALLQEDINRDPEKRFVHMCVRTGAMSFYDYQFEGAYLWDGVYTNMQIIDYLWGECFAELDITEGLDKLNKPILLGLGRYDYLVAPVSLWDSISQTFPQIQKVIFEHSGHNPMFEEEGMFNEVFEAFMRSE
ncbi:alpha/beta fold hydrolase [Longirhabdus pacifica]|uniref:alpha/beta fold hydrolase n=1 Tax=Longirhabdus pacifica TaxID=2305227 RepID=UPI0010087D97|nr:alpha/beta hydrolase [Longirhabdus pacifica]